MFRSTLIALVVTVAAVVWILSGQFDSAAGNNNAASPTVAGAAPAAGGDDPVLVSVRARELVAVPWESHVVARGRTEASRKVELRAEIPGRVIAVEIDKGTRAKEGQVIARLDAGDRNARLAEAMALVRQRQLEFDAATSLREKGFRAETKLAEAAALLDAAKAYVKRTEVDISRLAIRAPFAGVVDLRPVEIGDYLKEGNTLATIVDEDSYVAVAQISEREVGALAIGAKGVAILATGQTIGGTVVYIASTADPATRTFRVEMEIANTSRQVRDGVTAEIRIAVAPTLAHSVSPAVLTLDEKGIVGVRTVDRDDKVAFVPVKILGSDERGTWLSGLPRNVRLITVGQEYVRDGDRVRVVSENGAPAS